MKPFSLILNLILSSFVYPVLCNHKAKESEEFRPIRVGHAYSRDFEEIQNEKLRNYLKDRIKDVLVFFKTTLMVPKYEDPLIVSEPLRSSAEQKYNKDILIFIDVSTTDTCKRGSRTLAYASVCAINKTRNDRGLIQRTKSWKVNNVNHVEKKSNFIASRKVQPEIMTGVQSRKGIFSGLTAALLEDTGLLCFTDARLFRAKPKAAYPYCNWQDYILGQNMRMNLRRCDPKHKSVVQCNFEHNNTLSAEFAYFSGMHAVLEDMNVIHGTSVTGADKYTDHCPMWQDVFLGDKSIDVGDMVCDNNGNRPDSYRNIGLEIYGSRSICVEQAGIFIAMECLPPRMLNLIQTRFDTMYGAGCYQYKCENGRLWIRGAGNKDDVGTMQYKVCWAEGAKIRLIRYLKDEYGNPTALYRGTLICPSCKEICEKNGFVCEPDMPGINAKDYTPSPCGGYHHLSVKWLILAHAIGNLLLKLLH